MISRVLFIYPFVNWHLFNFAFLSLLLFRPISFRILNMLSHFKTVRQRLRIYLNENIYLPTTAQRKCTINTVLWYPFFPLSNKSWRYFLISTQRAFSLPFFLMKVLTFFVRVSFICVFLNFHLLVHRKSRSKLRVVQYRLLGMFMCLPNS